MLTRHFASVAVLFTAAVSLIACGPSRSQTDSGIPDAGCYPYCGGPGADGGHDAGNPDAGPGDEDGGQDAGCTSSYDGGLVTATLRDLRLSNACTLPFGAHVVVSDVVVNTVSDAYTGSKGDVAGFFWISDPADPPYGLWVSKSFFDKPGDFTPQAGDVLTIDGYLGRVSRFQAPDSYTGATANRLQLAQTKIGATFYNLQITRTDAGSIPDAVIVTPGEFGDSDGGWGRPNADHAGSRVYVQGPLEITNPSPAAMRRISADPDDSRYYGFEVTGGILVSNYKTFDADGGCAWRDVALDAGVNGQKVVFTQGIYGVWDTFSIPSCADGGTDLSSCYKNAGKVPGTTNDYTYVLHPQTCADFAGGEVQPQ